LQGRLADARVRFFGLFTVGYHRCVKFWIEHFSLHATGNDHAAPWSALWSAVNCAHRSHTKMKSWGGCRAGWLACRCVSLGMFAVEYCDTDLMQCVQVSQFAG
jgi:hypothetical protein